MCENLRQIAESISYHAQQEINGNYTNRAFARALCSFLAPWANGSQTLCVWLVNSENLRGQQDRAGNRSVNGTTYEGDGLPICKNTRVGEILIKAYQGNYSYCAPKGLVNVTIHNRSVYSPSHDGVQEGEIRLQGDATPHRFSGLSDLLRLQNVDLEKLSQHAEENQPYSNEGLQGYEGKKPIVELTHRNMLEASQEDAKRSHIFDGKMIIIDGGPGTGKTTTMISRLRFLLDDNALIYGDDSDSYNTGYENPLNRKQIDFLTKDGAAIHRWMFFSPTDSLLQYLRNSMNKEGLCVTDKNIRLLASFRTEMLRDYGLSVVGPFRLYSPLEDEGKLILSPNKVIEDFRAFFVGYCRDIVKNALGARAEVSSELRKTMEKIKGICSAYSEIKSVDELIVLFNSLYSEIHDVENNYKDDEIKKIKDRLNDILKSTTDKVTRSIMNDNDMVEQVRALFERWNGDSTKQPFDVQLASQTKSLIRQLALRLMDNQIHLSVKNQELYEIVGKKIVSSNDLNIIGEDAWFIEKFEGLCNNGLEIVLLNCIPECYKKYRNRIAQAANVIVEYRDMYDVKLLDKIIRKNNNKDLHPDEQDFLIGFINNLLLRIYKRAKDRFEQLHHKYAEAYKRNVKPVIGIDEATDYSLLDYYFMASFRYYDFSSLTLCGDIMQGLNANGIRDWQELQQIGLSEPEVYTLKVSYRQLPTMLNIAKEMYKDDQGVYPDYHSNMRQSPGEPQPLLYISEDEDDKIRWISERILNIVTAYNDRLPSVAIFVGDDVDIQALIQRFTDLDILNGIDVADCSGSRNLQSDAVKIFRIEEVKGMEFDAAFFYDIDTATKGHSEELMRRYLYVGISRARTHLAATMCSSKGNEGLKKYFTEDTQSWNPGD